MSAADQSKPASRKRPKTNRPKDPVKSKAGKASAAARKAKREKGDPIARPCSARRTDGSPCKNSAIRGGTVCARHGGSAPQVRAKANQRLVEMVLPAMRELHRILNNPHTADSDKLKAINMVLNRTGYNERQTIELGLREPNAWDAAGASAVKILRGMDNVVGPADEPEALPPGGGLGDDDLEAFLAWRDQQRAQEAQTKLAHGDHDVIQGSVVDRDADIPGPIDWEGRDRARSNRPSEFGGGPNQPTGSGSRAYERAGEP